MHRWRLWIPALLVALHAGSASAAPASTKVSAWVHAWDAPRTVRTAKWAGAGALALMGVILALGRVAKRHQEQHRHGR